jgi:hypothetical protein
MDQACGPYGPLPGAQLQDLAAALTLRRCPRTCALMRLTLLNQTKGRKCSKKAPL